MAGKRSTFLIWLQTNELCSSALVRFLDMTKICWLPAPPVSCARELHQLVSIPAPEHTEQLNWPHFIVLLLSFPSCPWISKHCMSSNSNFAIEFPIGFYLSHQVKIIMREPWRLAGRHYVFVTFCLLIMWSSLLCLLSNITPQPNIIIRGNLDYSELMIHFNALTLTLNLPLSLHNIFPNVNIWKL